MSNDPIVHIVDDDDDMRNSMTLVLEGAGFQTRSYSSAAAFFAATDRSAPGCVVTDIRMPALSGIGLLTQIQESGSPLPVIIVSGHADIALAVHAMKKGAVDFIEKPFSAEQLVKAVRAALQRIDRGAEKLARQNLPALSKRENEVLERVVAGKSSRVIGEELAISERTVEAHRASILRKTGTRNLAALVRLAAEQK